MNIDELQAGRELDALVAEKVMGYTLGTPPSPESAINLAGPEYPVTVPHYSTDIAAAWQVVEKFKDRDWRFILDKYDDGWGIEIELSGGKYGSGAVAETAPLAICRVALKAVGVVDATISISSRQE
jgi:hypothetical protein